MYPHQVLTSLIALFCALNGVLTNGAEQHDKPRYHLHNDLFAKYNQNARPLNSDNDTATLIYFTYSIYGIIDVDERQQTFITSGVVYMQWKDDLLKWNPADYGNATSIVVRQDDIWVPDINVINTMSGRDELGHERGPVLVESIGVVTWQPRGVFQTFCSFDTTYFPFDVQNCTVTIGTTQSISQEIKIIEMEEGLIDLLDFKRNNQWQLIRTYKSVVVEPDYLSWAIMSFAISRRPVKVICNIFIPVLFLSVTANLVFLLPSDGERTSTVVTILLAYAVYLTLVADSLPENSLKISNLEMYLLFLIGLASFNAIANVVILRLSQKTGTCGPIFTKCFRRLLPFLCLECCREKPRLRDVNVKGVEQDTGDEEESQPWVHSLINSPPNASISWTNAAKIIDRICFIAFSFTSLLISAVFYGIYMTGPQHPGNDRLASILPGAFA